jgi:hypothetical protein
MMSKDKLAERAAVATLERLGYEWSGYKYDRGGEAAPMCPSCGEFKDDGHAADCELAKLLAELRAAPAAPAPPTDAELDALMPEASYHESGPTAFNGELLCYTESDMRQAMRAAIEAAPAAPAPVDPSPGLLMSMAIRYDHALGLPGYYDGALFSGSGVTHAQRLESTLRTMRQLWEEVVGQGFYKRYAAAIAASIGKGDIK